MINFFGKAVDKALKRTGKTPQQLAYRVLPGFLLDLITKYLRVKTQGVNHIPKKGPYIIVSNHSGYMGFDALMLGHQVYQLRKRIPRIIAHKMWFLRPEISGHAEQMGMIPATYENGLKILEEGEPLILFPEGEEPVTDLQTVKFDSVSGNLDERKKWVSLVLKDRQYNKKTPYRLVLRDAETGIEQLSVDLIIDRAFTDDF